MEYVFVVPLIRLIVSGERHPTVGIVDVMIDPGDIADNGLCDKVGVWVMLGVGVWTRSGCAMKGGVSGQSAFQDTFCVPMLNADVCLEA